MPPKGWKSGKPPAVVVPVAATVAAKKPEPDARLEALTALLLALEGVLTGSAPADVQDVVKALYAKLKETL